MKKILFILFIAPLICFSQNNVPTQLRGNDSVESWVKSWVKLYGETPKAYSMAAKRAKSYEDGINLYSKAIELDTTYVEAWHSRAYLKYSLNDMKGAIEDYSEVIKLGEWFYGYLDDRTSNNPIIKSLGSTFKYDVTDSYRRRAEIKSSMDDLNGACEDYTDYYRLGGNERISDTDLESYCKKTAIERVKEFKEYLDLEIITKEYYDKKKNRLTPLILTIDLDNLD